MRTRMLRLALLGAVAAMPAASWAQTAPDRAPPAAATEGATRPNHTPPSATVPAARPDSAGAPAAARSTEGGNDAVRLEGGTRTGALEPGSNSFTEGQARSRIEAAGFTNVQNLRKDDGGVWRGVAMHGGQQVDVGLDYRGTVAPAPR